MQGWTRVKPLDRDNKSPQGWGVFVINFNIAQWRTWAPGLESVDDWQAWIRQPVILPNSDAAPDASFLPAMHSRRLTRRSRLAFSVGRPLAEGRPGLPLDFVYRYGDTH